MTTTKDYVNPDRLARVHNVESWAIRQGYLFYNNVIEMQDYVSVWALPRKAGVVCSHEWTPSDV